MGVTLWEAIGADDRQCGTDIAVAALLEVGLQQQALHFAAACMLFGLDSM